MHLFAEDKIQIANGIYHDILKDVQIDREYISKKFPHF